MEVPHIGLTGDFSFYHTSRDLWRLYPYSLIVLVEMEKFQCLCNEVIKEAVLSGTGGKIEICKVINNGV